MEDNIIKFKRDTSFRNRFFVPESFAHPAKMDAQLLIWVVEKYSKVGETILDPMFGSGTTMLGCMLGRNVIGVELEQKFVDMAKANWEIVKMHPQLGYDIGDCQIIQGDARQLEGLLVDKIISSPPFAAQTHKQERKQVAKGYFKEGKGRGAIGDLYTDSEHPDNIDRLPYGEIDKIITSPPYAVHQVGDPVFYAKAMMDMEGRDISKEAASGRADPENPSNISNLHYGQIDKIVTSPPFQEPEIRRSGQNKSREGYNYGSKLKMSSEHPDNISRLTENDYGNIDSIITSPPYERSLQGEPSEERIEIRAKYFEETDIKQGRKPGSRHTPGRMKHLKVVGSGYSPNVDNIGNLKSDSYLSAMLQVYQQCYKVLKPDGLMILVTKDFIRNKQRVLLSIDTLKLCERAGFVLEDWHERVLTQQSFWRTIYYQKHPEVERIDTEDILVFRKPGGAGLVDKIVTSPPYGDAEHNYKHGLKVLGKNFRGRKAWETRGQDEGYGDSEGQIGNLPHGDIDVVISSPPYEGSVSVPDSNQEARAERLKQAGYDPKDYQGGTGRNLQQDWSYHPK